MAIADEFEQVRSDPDPIRRGQRATDLIATYQQRATELARLRKEAIEEAHRNGLSYTEIANLLGVTKGRISQIRTTAPKAERAFFGVGPVAIAIPRRFGLEDGRERPYFDAHDQATQEALEQVLAELAIVTSRAAIDPDQEEVPTGDCIIVCGPKSAPIASGLLADDPNLSFDRSEEGWSIVDARTGRRHFSPFRLPDVKLTDIGYFSRRTSGGRVVVHIAGITSIGSLGVAHWLSKNLATVYDPASRFTSGIVECDFGEDLAVTATRLLVGPYTTTEP
ncbi:sigma-70 family RNA polymerase sigma factor [Nocardia puris]|uniref:sigma-70 family RNA polymerase sigma factor n=1 Tax=Nocardia puris TaxID=208602 RepID=UPI0018935061|nr:sigma-70 family RNA polymerase sigma factor [Nocardia puris]MBF6463057.1 sigma-70 family RNA polymerase sigma factor [Nocardia puris]